MRRPPPPIPDWLAKELPFDRYVVPVGDDLRMHVMERGRGRPVLLLHGNPTWGFLYRKIARLLEEGSFRAIMPDLIGLGLSDMPRDPSVHTLENHGRWLGDLVDRLDLRDVVLVIQDWGGPIGLRAFADRMDRLGAIVALNTVVGPPKPGFRATGFHRFARMPGVSDFAFRVLGFPQRGLRFAQGDRSSIRGVVARAYRWPLRYVPDRVAPLALARMVPDSFEHPSIAPLERCQQVYTGLRGKVAIVWGKKDPVLGSVLGHLRRLRPDAPVTETEAGHFLQEEVPGPIADAIRLVAG